MAIRVLLSMINFVVLLSLLIFVIWAVYTTFRIQDTRKAKKRKQGELPADAGVRDLIVAGNLPEAEDLYRRFTGVDEFTARDAVAEMEREIRLSAVDSHVRAALEQEGKAAAIEAYQVATGAELAEALDFVEQLAEKNRRG